MFRKLTGVLLMCGLGVAFVGCSDDGSNLVRAGGTVMYKNSPISGAMVTFIPENGPLATGTTDSEGKFTLTTGGRPGATVGNNKVTVVKVAASAAPKAEMKPEDMRSMQIQKDPAIAPPKSEIPEKYGTPEGGLVAEVTSKAAENDFEFILVD